MRWGFQKRKTNFVSLSSRTAHALSSQITPLPLRWQENLSGSHRDLLFLGSHFIISLEWLMEPSLDFHCGVYSDAPTGDCGWLGPSGLLSFIITHRLVVWSSLFVSGIISLSLAVYFVEFGPPPLVL
uniref:Uncharacterized protein n=1 Tax=Pipistrellus kuhlii TaxID=59472 RepID=A0A7J8B1M2_PIPKU|nr:hypothetical protein mPipKuh1_007797 [Pipistrellus kuhlii]